jgi:hypothetical protein
MKYHPSGLRTGGQVWRQCAKFGIAPETEQKGKQRLTEVRHKRRN